MWLNFIDSNGHKTNRRFTVPFILKQTKSSSIIYWIFCTLCIYVCLFVYFVNNLCFVQSHFTLYYVYIFVISVKEEIKTIYIWSYSGIVITDAQVSYRFLTAENLRLVLSRGSFLLWWRGGLVP